MLKKKTNQKLKIHHVCLKKQKKNKKNTQIIGSICNVFVQQQNNPKKTKISQRPITFFLKLFVDISQR